MSLPTTIATPSGRRASEVLRGYGSAIRAWEIWLHLAVQDIKNRYKRSVVGPLWIIISLAVLVAGLGFLFGGLFDRQGGRFVLYLTIGIMLWTLISSSFTAGGTAFIAAESYIRQIPQPKQVYILRNTVVSLIIFSFGLPVFFGAALFYRSFHPAPVWALLGLTVVVVACVAHSSIMAYLSVLFRDLPPAASSALQVAYFFTPIIYPVELLEERGMGWFLAVNPFYYLIEIVRHPLLEGVPPAPAIWVGAIVYTAVAWGVAVVVAVALDRRVAALL